jgi:hypothetical protein
MHALILVSASDDNVSSTRRRAAKQQDPSQKLKLSVSVSFNLVKTTFRLLPKKPAGTRNSYEHSTYHDWKVEVFLTFLQFSGSCLPPYPPLEKA